MMQQVAWNVKKRYIEGAWCGAGVEEPDGGGRGRQCVVLLRACVRLSLIHI